MTLKVLVVDDESMQRDMLQGFLNKQGFHAITAESGEEALHLFRDLPLQLVLLDHNMPGMNGDEVYARMKEINPQVRVIMITAFGAVDMAVKVMKLGADDLMEKPLDLKELLKKMRQIEQELVVQSEADIVTETLDRSTLPLRIIGSSSVMTGLLSMVQRVAASPWAVLIRGETGTGKELIARLIHLLSSRGKAAWVEVNCAAIPENLFESELFGHEKGAFTGAQQLKKGRLELAQGGSLFLDEIGELPLNLQAKLLRVLQEKKISRLGSEKDIAIDVRLVAATNRDLKQMVEDGLFREDLYYRLHVLEIEVPPLRQRKEDIKELISHFLKQSSPVPMQLSSEAMAVLVKYPYPGNVRELEHIIQRLVTMTRGALIRLEDLPPGIIMNKKTEPLPGNLENQLSSLEKGLLVEALEKHNWVQTRAAEELGISERVLRYKMGKLRLKK